MTVDCQFRPPIRVARKQSRQANQFDLVCQFQIGFIGGKADADVFQGDQKNRLIL